MEDQRICLSCVCQGIRKAMGHPENSPCKMTIAMVAALFFGGNISRSRSFLRDHNMLSESRLNRRLQGLDISMWPTAFHALNRLFCQANESCEYLVDGRGLSQGEELPLSVAHWEEVHRILQGEEVLLLRPRPQDIPLRFYDPSICCRSSRVKDDRLIACACRFAGYALGCSDSHNISTGCL